jgi:hypothetical protein
MWTGGSPSPVAEHPHSGTSSASYRNRLPFARLCTLQSKFSIAHCEFDFEKTKIGHHSPRHIVRRTPNGRHDLRCCVRSLISQMMQPQAESFAYLQPLTRVRRVLLCLPCDKREKAFPTARCMYRHACSCTAATRGGLSRSSCEKRPAFRSMEDPVRSSSLRTFTNTVGAGWCDDDICKSRSSPTRYVGVCSTLPESTPSRFCHHLLMVNIERPLHGSVVIEYHDAAQRSPPRTVSTSNPVRSKSIF